MSNGKVPKASDLVFDDEPPKASDLKLERPDPTEPPDPGFLPGVGRAARGVATGVESVVGGIGTRLPGFLQGGNNPKEIEAALASRPKPKDWIESAGEFGGEVLPTLAIPELGLGKLAGQALRAGQAYFMPSSMLAARSIPVAERAIEGATQGAIGGAMMPGDNSGKNAAIGAVGGAAVRGGGEALNAAWTAIPPNARHLANAIAAGAAVKGMEHMGMPNDWLVRAPVFFALWRASLLDLANKWGTRASRANPATLGATGVKLKQGFEEQ